MLRERGRCGGCQAVLHKFQNESRNRHCDSCSAHLVTRRIAYHCDLCGRFACTHCTDASRGGSVPTVPRPQLACGGCQGVLVAILINRASVNRPCHSCSASLGYRCFAYHCDSCTRIMCRQCTKALRLAARRRSGARRWISPVRSLKERQRLSCSIRRHKRPRLSPAAGTAESEVRTTEQQPVDTASVDEHKRAQMDDKHELLSPSADTAESEVRTMEQQPVDTASADKHERAQIENALKIYREARAQIRDIPTTSTRIRSDAPGFHPKCRARVSAVVQSCHL